MNGASGFSQYSPACLARLSRSAFSGPTITAAKVQWTLTVLILGFWFGFALALRERVVLPLQTLSNLLAALREGDYSIRGRAAKRDDTLGEVMLEVNALGATLRQQRLGAMEATALLRTGHVGNRSRRLHL
jgi:methyl-accepting chemotaxis protein